MSHKIYSIIISKYAVSFVSQLATTDRPIPTKGTASFVRVKRCTFMRRSNWQLLTSKPIPFPTYSTENTQLTHTGRYKNVLYIYFITTILIEMLRYSRFIVILECRVRPSDCLNAHWLRRSSCAVGTTERVHSSCLKKKQNFLNRQWFGTDRQTTASYNGRDVSQQLVL